MELTFTGLLIMALLALWLVGLLATQMSVIYGNIVGRDQGIPRWKRWDCFGLLPRFAFFSWVPNCHYELLFRDKDFFGEITPWNSVPLPERSITRIFWNPGRRKRFAVEDLCRSFLSHLGSQVLNSDTPSPYCLSYVGLAYYISHLPVCPLSRWRQFMIAQVFGDAERRPEILFVSPFFWLANQTEASHATA